MCACVCVCSLLDTCGFVTVDIKPNFLIASPPPSQVVFACLHVFSAGWESFPSLHPRTEDGRAHADDAIQRLNDATVPR